MGFDLFVVLTVFLAVIGLAELVRSIVFRIFSGTQNDTIMLLNPAKGYCEDIEYDLRSCVARIKWMKRGTKACVICLDTGMDESTRKVCELICEEFSFVSIMTISELVEKLNKQ